MEEEIARFDEFNRMLPIEVQFLRLTDGIDGGLDASWIDGGWLGPIARRGR